MLIFGDSLTGWGIIKVPPPSVVSRGRRRDTSGISEMGHYEKINVFNIEKLRNFCKDVNNSSMKPENTNKQFAPDITKDLGQKGNILLLMFFESYDENIAGLYVPIRFAQYRYVQCKTTRRPKHALLPLSIQPLLNSVTPELAKRICGDPSCR
jgi:hypothetical protein